MTLPYHPFRANHIDLTGNDVLEMQDPAHWFVITYTLMKCFGPLLFDNIESSANINNIPQSDSREVSLLRSQLQT